MNQIQFVQLRIHAARAATRSEKLSAGRGFLVGQVVLIAIMAACAGQLLPLYATLAFVPVLIRGFAWFATEPAPLAVHSLGKRELVYAAIFGLCLVAGMRVP